MDYYLTVLKKYAVFSGRAARSEYWYFVLFSFLISFAIGLVGIVGVPSKIVFGLSILYLLAIFIPSLAVFVRRLHDTNHSGWWFLVGFIPFIGGIILIVFMCLDSDLAENQYGVNPKVLTPTQPTQIV